MQQREKLLLRVTLGFVAVLVLWWAVRPTIAAIFFEPIGSRQTELAAVETELADRLVEIKRLKEATQTLRQVHGRSLPPRPLDAQRLYQAWLTDLARQVGIEELVVAPGRRTASRQAGGRGSTFTAVQVSLNGKARLSRLCRLLYLFYRTDLAQAVVDLSVTSPSSTGDPELTFALTAEGLSFPTAAERSTLFPQTNLAQDFNSGSGEQAMEVADAVGFPKKPGDRIRIGDEYLTVDAVDGSKWTVRGGVDETRPGRYKAGEVVELAPIHPLYASRTLDDYRRLVENSPFVKPAPPRSEPSPRTTPTVSRSDPAAETRLRGSVVIDGKPQAWLYGKPGSVRILIHPGSTIEVGDVKAVVVEIRRDHVLLENGGAVWKLNLGESLRSLEKVAEKGATEPGGATVDAASGTEMDE